MRGNVAFHAGVLTRLIGALAAGAAWAAMSVLAQEPGVPVVGDRAAFAEAMVRVGEDWEIVSTAIEGPTYLLNSVRGDGLTRLDAMGRTLAGVRGFFLGRALPDGVRQADRARDAVAELRVELARAEPDQAAALELVESVRAACATCHRLYREGDADRGFRFKPGVVE
ncbi:MAG: hypothetical protein Q7J25_14740 [Vicinamibacterales bacterium]|nr:hypothetical protein [Vicinamibacterales bacterium]